MRKSYSTVEGFIRERMADADDDTDHETQPITIRLSVQTVGDLEDLAGRLDLTRSMLARRLLEAAVDEAEEEYQRVSKGGKG